MPTQKEIIHLTFGTLSHHITTHFFNQQASHFEYPEQGIAGPSRRTDDDDLNEEDNPLLFAPAVDFQEGIGTRRSEPTFFPRQVVIDFKYNLGTAWDAYNVVVDDDAEDQEEGEDRYSVLKPSKAANEGYHAWNDAAEVQWVGGTDGKVKSTRFGPILDDEGDDYYEDSEEEEEEHHGKIAEETYTVQRTKARKLRRTNLTPASYAHNPHHPRSIRSLPYLFGGGALVPMDVRKEEGKVPFATFEMGIGLFRQLDKEESLLDEQLRWFAEDSDSLQSFSLSASTFDGFGGMAHEMIQLLSDEYSKVPVLAWGADQEIESELEDGIHKDRLIRLRKANNALSLWSLSSASLYTPIGLPQLLNDNVKFPPLQYLSSTIDWRDPYHLGGLFAAHIDTATLSSRLHNERSRQSTATLVNSLNWRRDTPIAQLGGCIPTPLLAPYAQTDRPLDPIEALLAARGYDPRKQDGRNASRMTDTERAKVAAEAIQESYLNFAPGQNVHGGKDKPYAQFTIARDDDRMAEAPTKAALEAWNALDEPAGGNCFIPAAYNIRWSSFPQMFRGLTTNGRPFPPAHKDEYNTEEQKKKRTKVQSIPMLASLSTTPESAHLLADARQFIDSTLIKGHEPLTAYGIGGSRGRSGAGQAANEETEGFLGGRDGLMEVRERLEELLGAYEEGLIAGRIKSTEEEDAIGTDEEYEDDHEEEWDL